MRQGKLASVAVVMSTYNGEKYVQEQLESVLAQDYGNLAVFVRDDGSRDDTVKVLERYERDGKISLERGKNVGVVRSFFSLLKSVAGRFNYVAFCDQDDRWHVDKVSRAVSVLAERDERVPQLYCSEYVFCDSDLRPQGKSHLNQRGVDFPTMLYENMVSGNTVLMNDALVRAVVNAGVDGVYCHDWWCALVASAIGELTFDDFASLDYRRTGANVSATGTGGMSLLRYRARKFLQGGELENVTLQLKKLESDFGTTMPMERRRLLGRFLNGGRLTKAVTPIRLRQKKSEELALRILFLLGRL